MGRDRVKEKRGVRRRRERQQQGAGAEEADGRAGAGGEAQERRAVERSEDGLEAAGAREPHERADVRRSEDAFRGGRTVAPAAGRAGAGGQVSERAGGRRSGVDRGVAREARVASGPEDRQGPVERLSVAEFLVRQRAGALPSGPRAELIGGRVVVPPLPRAVEVAAAVGLASRLEPVLMGRARLEFLPALRLARADLLRPDLALLDASPRFGRGASRPGGDALLVVEVLRGPAGKDLRLPLYARGGVGEVWLLDLERGLAEVYRVPGNGRYRSRTLWYAGERVGPVALDGVQVEVLAPF